MTINASVESTEYGLVNLPDEVSDRALNSFTRLPNGCWESHYNVQTPGGPQLRWTLDNEVYFMYHWRIVYYLQTGVIPEKYSRVRTCTNSQCVNPDHRSQR